MLDMRLPYWLGNPDDGVPKIDGPGPGPAMDRGIASRFAVYWPVLGLIALSVRELV